MVLSKLMEWLLGASVFLAVWAALVTEKIPLNLSTPIKEILWPLPIYLLMVFACYSLAVIGYRVITFNDCTEAAEELQKQIGEAKRDLKKLGLKT